MPWNDTAQLDYLKAEVREAVIQTILHVARQFPIIRFDAAMTLAKRHIQRLWFPEPGPGGAIPSRAEHALTKAEFDAAMPVEFWREVVDRVAVEAPDTLLLAEAFWMMEGYFVRTLGMHRVYNSAFMNMLRDEENAKYRAVIKNTLEFDPEILKRFVNFMNNPDEQTAVEQFGKGDKYFGVCDADGDDAGPADVRARPDRGLHREVRHGVPPRATGTSSPTHGSIARHEREIFPLLHGATCSRRRAVPALRLRRPTTARWTRTCSPTRTGAATSARSSSTTTAIASARGWIRESCAYAGAGGEGRPSGGCAGGRWRGLGLIVG